MRALARTAKTSWLAQSFYACVLAQVLPKKAGRAIIILTAVGAMSVVAGPFSHPVTRAQLTLQVRSVVQHSLVSVMTASVLGLAAQNLVPA